MTKDIDVVGPSAPLRQVAAGMAQKSIGCMVVMKDADVVGIFTTIDALHALARTIDS